jgi:hypothetical protein
MLSSWPRLVLACVVASASECVAAMDDDSWDAMYGGYNGNDGFPTEELDRPNPALLGVRGSRNSACLFRPAGPEGVVYDLTPMQQLEHDFTGSTTGGYIYRFNVCGNTIKVCNDMPSPASKWRGSKCNNLGDPQSMRLALLDPAKPGSGVRASFDQGDICKRQTDDGQTTMGSRVISYEVRTSTRDARVATPRPPWYTVNPPHQRVTLPSPRPLTRHVHP